MHISAQDALEKLFHPQSLAVIGASEKAGSFNAGKTSLMLRHFSGHTYLIHPERHTIFNNNVWKSVEEVPDAIDMALVMVPAARVPEALESCGRKGIKVAQILSGGFNENTPEGKSLNKKIHDILETFPLRIVGPNCIGTYCPSAGIHLIDGCSTIPGRIGFISQSGGMSVDLAVRGSSMGIRYSKLVSIGNCIDIGHSDCLEYMFQSSDTDIIGIYLESISNGRMFLNLLEKCSRKKKIVILKGGRTELGSSAAMSHTGGMASNYKIWQAVFRQTGVMEVTTLDEMLNTLLALQNIRHSGKGVAIIGNGGGATVLAADSCSEEHLSLASLSDHTLSLMQEYSHGISRHNINPIDLNAMELSENDGTIFGKLLETISCDQNVGHVLFHFNLISFLNQGNTEHVLTRLIEEACRTAHLRSNLVAVLRSSGNARLEALRCSLAEKLGEQGIPVYTTIEDAIHAISVAEHTGASL